MKRNSYEITKKEQLQLNYLVGAKVLISTIEKHAVESKITQKELEFLAGLTDTIINLLNKKPDLDHNNHIMLKFFSDAILKGMKPQGGWDATKGAPPATEIGQYWIIIKPGTIDKVKYDLHDTVYVEQITPKVNFHRFPDSSDVVRVRTKKGFEKFFKISPEQGLVEIEPLFGDDGFAKASALKAFKIKGGKNGKNSTFHLDAKTGIFYIDVDASGNPPKKFQIKQTDLKQGKYIAEHGLNEQYALNIIVCDGSNNDIEPDINRFSKTQTIFDFTYMQPLTGTINISIQKQG